MSWLTYSMTRAFGYSSGHAVSAPTYEHLLAQVIRVAIGD
jgi:hypothetical protein